MFAIVYPIIVLFAIILYKPYSLDLETNYGATPFFWTTNITNWDLERMLEATIGASPPYLVHAKEQKISPAERGKNPSFSSRISQLTMFDYQRYPDISRRHGEMGSHSEDLNLELGKLM